MNDIIKSAIDQYIDKREANLIVYDARQELINYYTSLHVASNNAVYKEAILYLEASPLSFFKELAEKLGIGIKDIIKFFKDSRVVKFFGKIKWSFKKLYGLLKDGRKNLKILADTVKEYVENNKIVKWTTEQIKKLDEFLKSHPKTRRLAGIAVAGILIYIWFNMAFTGDPAYDFGMEDVLAALAGKFVLSDIFGGSKGIKLLSLFAAGIAGLSFPWPGPASIKFISAILSTIAKKLGIRLKIKKSHEVDNMLSNEILKISEEIQKVAISLGDILKPNGRAITNLGFSDGTKIPNMPTHHISRDGWLRGERTKAGIMFREVKLLSGTKEYDAVNLYQISYKYYPDAHGELDDVSKNWKSSKGWLWVSKTSSFKDKMPDIKEIVKWMNNQTSKWKP